ncbi:hypothetical protein V3C99_000850 [Haemonchus contortus]
MTDEERPTDENTDMKEQIPRVSTAKAFSIRKGENLTVSTQTTQESSKNTTKGTTVDNTQKTLNQPAQITKKTVIESECPSTEKSKSGEKDSRNRMDDLKDNLQYRGQMRRKRIESDRKELRRKIRKVARFAMILILGIELLFVGLYLLAIIIISGMINSTIVEPWVFRLEPTSHRFKEFAVSSNSESCNEEARTLYLEDHSTYGIAFAMSLCLMKSAPHRGGLGGASVAVMVDLDKNLCQQTQGYPRYPPLHNRGEVRGPNRMFSDHWKQLFMQPGESHTWMALLSKINEDEKKRLSRKIFRDEAKVFAVDANLARHLRIMDTTLALLSTHDRLLSKRFHGKLEGELVTAPLDFFNESGSNVSERNWSTRDPSITLSRFEKFFGNLNRSYVEWIDGIQQKVGEYKVCVPSKPENSSIILEALRSRTKAQLKYPIQNAHFEAYVAMEKAIQLARNSSAFYGLPKEKVERSNKGTHYKRISFRKEFPYNSNFFALVDVKKRQAIACTSTLGSSFGSLMSSSSWTPPTIFNNLISFVTTPDEETGITNAFLFQPLIAFDKNIRIVWAGIGGSTTISLGMPRMVTSIIWRLFHGTPLLHATGSPMIFPQQNKYTMYNEGFEWQTLALIQNVINDWLLRRNVTKRPLYRINNEYTRRSLMDNAAVIDVTGPSNSSVLIPFHFSNDDDQVMPSGV